MKSKDRKKDRIENPERSQDQSGFLLFLISLKSDSTSSYN